MTLEQLQAMSDRELDTLAAIKFLWGGFVNVPSDDWMPTANMENVRKLENELNPNEFHTYTIELMKMTDGFGSITYRDVSNLLRLNARQRTIAAILAKEN